MFLKKGSTQCRPCPASCSSLRLRQPRKGFGRRLSQDFADVCNVSASVSHLYPKILERILPHSPSDDGPIRRGNIRGSTWAMHSTPNSQLPSQKLLEDRLAHRSLRGPCGAAEYSQANCRRGASTTVRPISLSHLHRAARHAVLLWMLCLRVVYFYTYVYFYFFEHHHYHRHYY